MAWAASSTQNIPEVTVLSPGAESLTIGGFQTGGAAFGGRVYETAVWNEPGTPANLQRKIAAILSLPRTASPPTFATARPCTTAPTRGPANSATGLHTAWNHGPRYDATRGQLFGMQSWNRLGDEVSINTTATQPRFQFAMGDDLGIVPIAGVVPDGVAAAGAATTTPLRAGRRRRRYGRRHRRRRPSRRLGEAQLAAGDPVRRCNRPAVNQVRAFDAAGPIHGQVWLRLATAPPAGAALRVTAGGSSPTSISPPSRR